MKKIIPMPDKQFMAHMCIKPAGRQIKENNAALYAMKLNFSVSVGLEKINAVTGACGFSEELAVENARQVAIEQIIPFIPNEQTISRYMDAVAESIEEKSGGKLEAVKVEFLGYSYLYPLEPADTNETEEP